MTSLHVQGGQKNCTPYFSQQIVLHCAAIRLALSDLSVTHVISHKRIIF